MKAPQTRKHRRVEGTAAPAPAHPAAASGNKPAPGSLEKAVLSEGERRGRRTQLSGKVSAWLLQNPSALLNQSSELPEW